MRKLLIYSCFLLLFLSSCVEKPTAEERFIGGIPDEGAFVLCEGLWGHNNTDIIVKDRRSEGVPEENFHSLFGEFIGDIGSDIEITKDLELIITLTGSKEIVWANIESNEIVSKSRLDNDNFSPRKLVNDNGFFYYTNLFNNKVGSFYLNEGEILLTNETFKTGPAPEDISKVGNYIYVANSGYGDYKQDEENAGTVQKIDLETGESEFLYAGKNVIHLEYFEKENLLAAAYLNTPSNVNLGEPGGIAFIELDSFALKMRMEVMDLNTIAAVPEISELYYIGENGLYKTGIDEEKLSPKLVLENNSVDVWYSLSYNHFDNEIWIGNAKNYQTKGEIIIFDIGTESIKERFGVGMNPTKVAFYRK